MSEQIVMFIIHVPMLLLIYIIGLVTPYVTRKELVFSIRFPEAFAQSEQIQSLKRQYLKQYGITGGIFCIALASAILLRPNPLFPIGGTFLLVVIMVAFFLSFRKKAQTIKKSTNVTGGKKQIAIMDTEFRKNAPLPSWFWFLIPWAIVAVNFAIVFLVYDRIPDMIPMQYNFKGEVSRWAIKSVGQVLLMPGLMVFSTLLMTIMFRAVKSAKPQISAEKPGKSRFQNARFRFQWATWAIVFSILLNITFTFANLKITTLLKTSFATTMIFFTIMVMITLLYTLLIAIRVGQGGSRVKVPDGEAETGNINRDDDWFWKAGLFYYNPDDPSLWVEHRFGFGYTINFGNKKSVWFITGLLVIILLSFVPLLL
jgi:uncharacterized membrane protein